MIKKSSLDIGYVTGVHNAKWSENENSQKYACFFNILS